MTRVTVVGDVMLDVVARASGPTQPTSDTPAAVHVGRGGSAANAAMRLAAAGCAVTFVGAVGRDDVGRLVRLAFERAGVETLLLEVDEPTGVVVALVDEDGQRAMYTSRGANRRLSLDHVGRALDRSADHVHVSGYTVLDDETRSVGQGALDLARARVDSVSIDACSVGPLSRIGPRVFLAATASATTLFANEEEAVVLGGGSLDDALCELGERYSEVVVTLGALGAVVRSAGASERAPALAREIVDTTGAGDAVTGAYLAARLRGESAREALDAAMAAAGRVVGGLGADGQSRR